MFSLTKLLIELELLQQVYKRTNSDHKEGLQAEKVTPDIEENKYPKVFKNGYGYELFKYLVKVDDEKISPSWAQKYFDLFKDEKLIKSTSKKINFIRFLKDEFQIDFPELDHRASYNEEAYFLKGIEKDFQIKYSISRF